MDSSLDHEEDEDAMEENTSPPNTRGPANLDKVRKAVDLSVEFDPVTFVPLGKSGTKYTNWVGLETRTSVSILLEDWKKVGEEEKDHLWSAIQKHWNIPNDENISQIKTSTLKIANTSWRNFKKNLIRNFLRKGKVPYSKYKFIKEPMWADFCNLKSAPEFAVKSQIGKDRVKLNKNPHRLGSRGYPGKKPQWEKEKAQGKCPELFSISTERARDFLLARRVKVGPDKYELPENLLPLASQIIEKERLTPGEDSLVAVMGKDHPGSTRGVSHNVGVRTTLPNLASKKRKQEDVESLKRTVENQSELIKNMQEQIQVILSQQNPSSSSPGMRHSSADSTTCLEWATALEKPTQCELIHGPTRLACAKGVVHPIGNGILHNIPMMTGCIKVQIDTVYDGFGNVDLPVHNEEMETLKDANGAFIQWPQGDIVLHKVSTRNVAKPSPMAEKCHPRKSLISAPTQVAKEDLEADSKRQKLPLKSKVKHSMALKINMPAKVRARPLELQRFYTRLNSNDEWRRNGVTFEADKGVFGPEKMLIAISYEDLYDLCGNGLLESGIIAAFMSGLHSVLSQKARSNQCAFLHPDTIGDLQIRTSPSHVTNLIYGVFTQNKNKEFFIAPYVDGNHWVLLLVLPKCRSVYVLDSTHDLSKKKPESYHIKAVLDKAILKYNTCVEPVSWIILECNQQTSDWECGYYVCKWLFHFVMEHQYTFPKQIPWKKQSFSVAELDGIAISIVNRLSISYLKT